MIAPSGADDVAGALYTQPKLRKLRFLMTDNNRIFVPEQLLDESANGRPSAAKGSLR